MQEQNYSFVELKKELLAEPITSALFNIIRFFADGCKVMYNNVDEI